MELDLTKPIYIYDDRNKYDWFFKVKTVLFSDKDVCLCLAKCSDLNAEVADEKILFNLQNGKVENSDYYSWIATNDIILTD